MNLLINYLLSVEVEELESFYNPFSKLLEDHKGFKYFDFGSFRSVWSNKDYVIKIPVDKDGLLDNLMEAKAWKKYKNNPTNLGIVLAPCRLLSNFALLMPFINTCTYHQKELIEWSDKVDAQQIGMLNGRTVAYDFAHNLTERLTWETELGVSESWFRKLGPKY